MSKSIRLLNRSLDFSGVSDEDSYYLSLRDGMEDAFTRLCVKYLPKDGVAIDVGANIGVTSSILTQVMPRGSIHAFEPSPTVFRELQRNVTVNALHGVSLHNMALGDRVGETAFVDNSAYGHITPGLGGSIVKLTTLDQVASNLDLSRIDLIKVDVEGYEQSVLRGGAQIISRFNPLVYVEFNSWTLLSIGKVNPIDFLEWLLAEFQFVALVAPDGLKRITREGYKGFVFDNMAYAGCVQNLLLRKVDGPEQVACSVLDGVEAPDAEKQLQWSTRRTQSLEQKLHSTELKLRLLKSSRSWRYTAPLRYLRAALGKSRKA